MAAPVGGQIFSEILPYLEVSKGNLEELEEIEEIEAPDLLGKTLEEAQKLTKETGIELIIQNEEEELDKKTTVVKEQIPKAGIKMKKGTKIYVEY